MDFILDNQQTLSQTLSAELRVLYSRIYTQHKKHSFAVYKHYIGCPTKRRRRRRTTTPRFVKPHREGFLSSCLLHEATHASLDTDHGRSPAWREAQARDPNFISEYAKQNPEGEDLAETLGPYLAVRLRPDRCSLEDRELVLNGIPNRVAYLDALGLSMDIVA